MRPKHTETLTQPKAGPTMLEVAERLFGRKFRPAAKLFRFLNTKERHLELNRALWDAGWRPAKKLKGKILLKTADRLFQGFLKRLDESNRDTRFAYFVEEVVLFGSYLRREERVTDIDLCIKYYRKTLAKVQLKIGSLMLHHGVNEKMGYALSLSEIQDFLTANHPRYHMSEAGAARRLGAPHKVIYRIPDAKEFGRLLTATEHQVDARHLHEFLEARLAGSNLSGAGNSPETAARQAQAKSRRPGGRE